MDIQRKLYKPDISKEEFYNVLKEIVEPVYIAAKNMGFNNWRLS